MRRLFLALAVLVLLVAAWLRLWQLHQYPPGPHYDEAVELLITRSIAFGGARFFPIVPSYQGREVLFYYLNAPLLSLFGDHIFTLQISNVLSNLISLAASVALGRTMFGGRRGVIVGLAMGIAFAISFPQVWLSRQAFRTSALLLCQCLALLCLWRGLKARRYDWLWLAVGGVFAGAALYTYMASRLFPLWLLIGGALLIALDRGNRRKRLRQGVVFFGAMAIIAAPMIAFAVREPDIFIGRLTEVTQTDDAITLGESIIRHLKMFFIKGEDLLRYNDPGRPYLTLPEGILMLLGMGVGLWRLLRGQGSALERAAYGLALLSPLMVIPSVISVGGFPPNHMRSIGMIPLLFVLVAVGAEWVLSKINLSPDPSPQAERGDAADLVRRAVQVKVDVVHADPYENGVRAHLNLGHTFAHAIERVSNYSWLHGEAVGVGLVAAARLSWALGLCDASLPEEVEDRVANVGLPTRIKDGFEPEALYAAMGTDKKWRAGRSRFVLLRAIGEPLIVEDVPKQTVIDVLETLL
ncbi:MAG: glycosyltransferase family 39 protein [Burkholderiales bacterium]|nr:glycosyltransferase family 39 protein [Anaerolineae bacterium]